MVTSLQVGSVRCHLLSDGRNLMDGGGFFGVVPRILWQRVIEPNAQHKVPSENRSLLIESDAGLILVDTGLGDKFSSKQREILGMVAQTDRLVTDLAQTGFTPGDIDVVILTHLHGDHVGGATRWDTPDHSPGPVVPTFPNARYLVQRIDFADASFPNERTLATYIPANWQPLRDSGQLVVVNGPQQLGSSVRTDISPGHTAAFQTVWVESGGDSLIFLGDACSWAAHMNRLAWVPAYDVYPLTSIETKRRLRADIMARDALLVFQHDPHVATGRLREGTRGPEVKTEITQDAWAGLED